MTPKSTFYTLTWLLMAGIGSTLIILAGVHLYLSPSLPSVDSLRDVRLQTPLRIYSYDGNLIGEIGEKRRTPVTYQNIPQGYIDALLSAEDDQFYSHNGVSIKGLMRASSQLLMSGDIQGGGSTITMQVARNFFLTRRQEFKRKFNEILLALRIERELSKEEILELYVNVIFLGNRAYGIEAAANVYYGATLSELELPQLAMLAGLPKAPSAINPLANPKRALTRRNWILSRMHSLEKISDAEYVAAKSTPLSAQYSGSNLEVSAQYVAEMARKKAIGFFGLEAYTEGYNIYTTIHSDLQKSAQASVISGLLEYDQRHGYRGAEQNIAPPEQLREHLLKLSSPPNTDQNTKTPEDKDSAPSPATATASPKEQTTDIEIIKQQWLTNLHKTLDKTPTYANLLPAAVIGITEQSVTVLTKTGNTETITWENGLKQARAYISVNRRGRSPKTTADIVSLGDIVRVRQENNHWYFTQIPNAQGALVSLDAKTGAVLALVGGLDFNQSKFNRATQATRQPGSNFKPFIYTAALENGFTAASIINDAPIVFEDSQLETDWRPENAGGKFFGPTRLRKALYMSRNLVSIRVLQSIGINNALANLGRFGIESSQLPRDLSVALGSFAMTPMDVATGYAVFANGGYQIAPYFIDRIEDSKGEVVFRSEKLTVCSECENENENENDQNDTQSDAVAPEDPTLLDNTLTADINDTAEEVKEETIITPAPRVIDERVAYIMDSMLKDVVKRGTATKAKQLKRNDIAGKTGTTNKATNAWFSGYGGDIVTTAWVGFDQVASLGGNEYGGTAALPIWINYMEDALKGKPEIQLPRPPNLVTTRINPKTGMRVKPGAPNAIFEMFRAEHVPELDADDTDTQSPWDSQEEFSTEDIF